MTVDRYDSLAPGSVVATLRSLPRRYHQAVTADPDLAIDDVAQVAVDGLSILGLLVDTNRSLVMLERALERTVVSSRPVLHRGTIDPAERVWTDEPATSVSRELDRLAEVCEALADRADRVPARDWLRPAAITGGGEITALDIAREAARTGVENLRSLEQVVAEMSRRAAS